MKKRIVIHPLLFAAYGVLGVYSSNIVEIQLTDLWRPLVVSIILAVLFIPLYYLLVRDWHRAGFLATLTVFIVLYFGHAVNAVEAVLNVRSLGYVQIGMVVFWVATLVIASTGRFWKLIRGSPKTTLYLNIAGLLVLIMPVCVATTQLVRYSKDRQEISQYVSRETVTVQADPATLPDIYYIILDGYGRQDVMKDLYGLDNSGFISWLEGKGFYVAGQSRSNYIRTMWSLSSSLNMDYVNQFTSSVRFLVFDSIVQSVLEKSGYTTIGMPSATYYTQLTHVDEYYSPYSRNTITPFEGILILNSIIGPFASDLKLKIPLPSYDYQRELILFTLRQIPEVVSEPGPKFIFAHLLAPHPPFSFKADGSIVNTPRPYWIGDATDFEGTKEEYLDGYSNQLEFISSRIEGVVEAIRANSTRPFVIILQGDHGGGAYLDFTTLEKNACLVERFSILNAYYFSPGAAREKALAQLTPDITPVNTFRVIFNAYFGTDLELLPNRNYYTSNAQMYDYIDVTDRANEPCQVTK